MDQRVYHGKLSPLDFARSLTANFNRGNMRVHQMGGGDQIVIQIASLAQPTSGGQTALGITLQAHEDGVVVQVGKQAWLGVAASLGYTAIAALRNPFSLLQRIDDLAQDIEYIQLTDEVWKIVEQTARSLGSTYQLSEKLRRLVCEYCNTPNKVGEPSCIACGAPLGNIQPMTCMNCGYIVSKSDRVCPNCKSKLTG
jgi:hypothetical protein